MIKKYNEYHVNEGLEFTVGDNDSEGVDVFSGEPQFADEQITRDIVKSYIDQVERATNANVIEVQGECTESDSDLKFKLDDNNTIEVTYEFHPFTPKTTVKVDGFDSKSFGKGNKSSYDYDEKESKYDRDDGVHDMVRDIYMDNNILEIEPTHKIDLPDELFGNDPYFFYDSDEQTDKRSVYFESEEAAQAWIKMLRISINSDN